MPLPREQFLVATCFHDLAAVHRENAIRMPNGG
jgi:hypothetical protein